MISPGRGVRWPVYAWLAAALLVAGTALLATSWAGSRPGPPMPSADAAGSIEATSPRTGAPPITTPRQTSNPAPPAAAGPEPDPANPAVTTGSSPAPTIATAPTGSMRITGPVLAPSTPVSLSIPALKVASALVRLGLNPDGTVQVPDLNDPDSRPGWYEKSPTPGAPGPSIILGHIDSREYGPGVFYQLGDLRPGDTVEVTRADGTVAVFRVDSVSVYPKDQFPTLAVYGNIDHAGLRLITCGGTFNPSEQSYESNIVANATLISSHPRK